jgi:hypothetical protein
LKFLPSALKEWRKLDGSMQATERIEDLFTTLTL